MTFKHDDTVYAQNDSQYQTIFIGVCFILKSTFVSTKVCSPLSENTCSIFDIISFTSSLSARPLFSSTSLLVFTSYITMFDSKLEFKTLSKVSLKYWYEPYYYFGHFYLFFI